jgi:hypothetical protein
VFNDSIHPDDLERIYEVAKHAIERKELYKVEYRIWRPDGELRRVRSWGQCYYDERGTPFT